MVAPFIRSSAPEHLMGRSDDWVRTRESLKRTRRCTMMSDEEPRRCGVAPQEGNEIRRRRRPRQALGRRSPPGRAGASAPTTILLLLLAAFLSGCATLVPSVGSIAMMMMRMMSAVDAAAFVACHRGPPSSSPQRRGPPPPSQPTTILRPRQGTMTDEAESAAEDRDTAKRTMSASSWRTSSRLHQIDRDLSDGRNGRRSTHTVGFSRRDVVRWAVGVVTAATSVAVTAATTPTANAAGNDDGGGGDPLEKVRLGEGKWSRVDRAASTTGADDSALASCRVSRPPPEFVTYLTRFLIAYDDDGLAEWWRQLEVQYRLLSTVERMDNLRSKFASMAKSLELAVTRFLVADNNSCRSMDRHDYERLWDVLATRYAVGNESNAAQQLAILFALLPPTLQPIERMAKVVRESHDVFRPPSSYVDTEGDSLVSLLPLDEFRCALMAGAGYYAIRPSISDLQDGSTSDVPVKAGAVPTVFGPLSSTPFVRELDRYSLKTYGLFGIAGATGCAFTHAVVIPLDVVKTKKQVDPVNEVQSNASPVASGSTTTTRGASSLLSREPQLEIASVGGGGGSALGALVKREGLSGLFLGAEATIIGYSWYGLSVYPSYTLFKRVLAHGPILSPDVAILHGNDIALVAGAMAAVIASLGLTPMEAARIRVVANPGKYRPLGVWGTLSEIAKEGVQGGVSGWTALYAGLPSLLARQVIFGSVKFLAFERSCEWIYATWPTLRDATWTCLTVSLVAGGLSGTLSSVVSQPADSVLTYVAQNRDGSATKLGLFEGCVDMVQKDGIGSLFRGLSSRCVWAGSIIAGQFLLYDVFRNYFGVSTDDLSQVYSIAIPSN